MKPVQTELPANGFLLTWKLKAGDLPEAAKVAIAGDMQAQVMGEFHGAEVAIHGALDADAPLVQALDTHGEALYFKRCTLAKPALPLAVIAPVITGGNEFTAITIQVFVRKSQ